MTVIPFEALISLAAALFGAFAFIFGKARGYNKGKTEARYTQIKADADRAQKIRERADEARAKFPPPPGATVSTPDSPVFKKGKVNVIKTDSRPTLSPDERLRQRGRLRSD